MEARFYAAPSKPDWFERELKWLDPGLYVQWHGRERAADESRDIEADRPCWQIWRRMSERDKVLVERRGILRHEEIQRGQPALVMRVVNEEGEFRPLDRRVFEELVAGDPSRYSSNLLDGFRKMQGKRRAARKKAEKEAGEAEAAETVDEVLRAATRPGRLATVGVDGLKKGESTDYTD